jgi:hypothetical protein
VKAENMYGIIAPINKPAKMSGSVNEIRLLSYNPALCKKPP